MSGDIVTTFENGFMNDLDEVFERYDKDGRIICKDWSKYGEGNVNYKMENLTEEELMDGIKRISRDYYSLPNIIRRSFTNTNYSPYRVFIKIIRNVSVRKFYLTEKLTIG